MGKQEKIYVLEVEICNICKGERLIQVTLADEAKPSTHSHMPIKLIICPLCTGNGYLKIIKK